MNIKTSLVLFSLLMPLGAIGGELSGRDAHITDAVEAMFPTANSDGFVSIKLAVSDVGFEEDRIRVQIDVNARSLAGLRMDCVAVFTGSIMKPDVASNAVQIIDGRFDYGQMEGLTADYREMVVSLVEAAVKRRLEGKPIVMPSTEPPRVSWRPLSLSSGRQLFLLSQ